MKIEVRYLSKSGNTAKVAESIAKAVNVSAEPITVPVSDDTDLLFLGGATYAFGIDDKMKQYVSGLPQTVKCVAVFTTSAIVKSAFGQIQQALEDRGIKVADRAFYCRGEFRVMHKGRPNSDDLKKAGEFAKTVI
ncbi:MAG: flavodoxin [Oscillospiraceae bacterium]|jgi:flavodoxin|nr:flavodoxin [Oscillospiraceae bacterium]